MDNVQTILVAVKNTQSGPSAALRKAAQLAAASGARLELFHAICTAVYIDAYPLEPCALRSLQRCRRAAWLADLEKLAQPLREQGLTAGVSVDWDYPVAEAIVRRARRIKADLIVAEPHAGHRIAPLLLHVTDWELLRLSPIPVLIVKSGEPYRKPVILAAVDATHALAKPAQLDDAILHAGERFAEGLHGSLHALHCFSATPMIPVSVEAVSPDLLQTLEEDARRHSRQTFDQVLKGSDIPPRRRHLVAGHPTVAIPQAARELGSSILVMGAVSRSGLKRFFIGNTAERVLDQTPCDILVVKPRRFVTRVRRARRGMHLVPGARIPLPY